MKAADERLKIDFDENEIERLMVVGLWCAHPDHVLRPSIRQAISALKFEAPLPSLPPTMPVPTFVVPSMDLLNTASSISVSTGVNSASTASTTQSSASSSTSLLRSCRTEV